jgi:hypothetical protein
MVEEQNQLSPPLDKRSTIDPKYSWEALRCLRRAKPSQDGDALETQYRHTLENLGKEICLQLPVRLQISKGVVLNVPLNQNTLHLMI